jgi:hypothetical protein
MYQNVLQRIRELYGDVVNHNWMHIALSSEFEDAEAALAYLKAQGHIIYIRLRDGRSIIRPSDS